jgi:parallel beta-helix repeat protein
VILGAGTGHGIWVYQGQRNLIQGNEIEGNAGCGIALDASSGENAYRKNLLRGNSGGAVCDSGTGNTDAGGNIP